MADCEFDSDNYYEDDMSDYSELNDNSCSDDEWDYGRLVGIASFTTNGIINDIPYIWNGIEIFTESEQSIQALIGNKNNCDECSVNIQTGILDNDTYIMGVSWLGIDPKTGADIIRIETDKDPITIFVCSCDEHQLSHLFKISCKEYEMIL